MQILSPGKSIFASRVLWVNGLTVAAAVLTALSGVAHNLPPDAMPYIVSALAAVNFALRFLTTVPIATKV